MLNIELITKLYTNGTHESKLITVPNISCIFGLNTKWDQTTAKLLGVKIP